MRYINSLLIAILLPVIGLLTVACSVKDKEGKIHELDKKYLSESQLFALHQAIESDPDNPENYYKRSKVYFDRQENSKALQDIEQAIKLNNSEGKYYLLQAKIFEVSHKIPEAVEAAKVAEGLKVNDAEIKILLAKLYLELNQKENAQQYLLQASQITPYHPDVFLIKGKLAAIQGDTSLAITDYYSSINKDTFNTEAYKELSKIYFNKHKYDTAMMFVSMGRAIEPEDAFFYYMDGRFMEHLNMKESSKASYLNSLDFDSTFFDSYKALAMIYYKESKDDKAAGYFEKELKYNPNSVSSGLLLSEIYEKQNKGYLAIPILERIVAKDTSNAKAKNDLQRLYVLYPVKVVKKDTIQEQTIKVDTVKKALPTKVDTASKKPVIKNIPKKSSEPTKEIKKFTPIIRNPDSIKIDKRKDSAE